ncbi:MAG TPA: class I SAM-dependent methyltransferase [Anaerolineales bacterium]|nr:class I SAM-dependent methyltransferase [Anaerolineales bacterium]
MRSSGEAWEAIYRKDANVFPEVFPRFPELAEAFAAHGCRTILDLGCGSGRHVVALAKLGFQTWGLDLAPTGLRLAARWLDEESLRAPLVLSDARLPLPVRGAAFDGLLSTQVIHHGTLATIRAAVREVRRVVRPGGLVFITVPHRLDGDVSHEEIEPGTFVPRSGIEEGVPHHIFSPQELQAEMDGFRPIEVAPRGPVVLAFLGIREPDVAGV